MKNKITKYIHKHTVRAVLYSQNDPLDNLFSLINTHFYLKNTHDHFTTTIEPISGVTQISFKFFWAEQMVVIAPGEYLVASPYMVDLQVLSAKGLKQLYLKKPSTKKVSKV